MRETVKISYRQQCEGCSQIFISPIILFAVHGQSFNPERFQCKECCCSFEIVQNLAKHMKEKHDEESKIIPDTDNEESSEDTDNGSNEPAEPEGKARLDGSPNRQDQTQTNSSKMFTCLERKTDGSECGYEAWRKSVLECHKRQVHFKRYRCETYDQTFGVRKALEVHKRSEIHRKRGKRGAGLKKIHA